MYYFSTFSYRDFEQRIICVYVCVYARARARAYLSFHFHNSENNHELGAYRSRDFLSPCRLRPRGKARPINNYEFF